MAYFLKKTKNKKGLYLQIYESHWDAGRGHTVNKSVRAIGYVHELEEKGIACPIEHFKAEVDAMNAQRKAQRKTSTQKRITDVSPERYLGHFIVRAINNALGVENDFKYLTLASSFHFDLFGLLCDLVYARLVSPCSKHKTYTTVLPQLEGANKAYSTDQLYDGLEFLGQEYKKVIEMYNAKINEVFGCDTTKTYFDCTNFYFEIDQEDEFRRKGPSKEKRCDPIVGMGLLLDRNCVPLGMTLYPGNESEKPKLREVVSDLKQRNNIKGRTIHVADKGLNCADNIAQTLFSGDGYIFSKSVKQLSQQEQRWALSEDSWCEVKRADGRVRYFYKSCVDDFEYNITGSDGKKKKVALKEKRIVTFNPALAAKQRAEIARQVDKARSCRLGGAKRKEYGDAAKFVVFEPVDKAGEKTDEKIAVRINKEAVECAYSTAGYNMLVTSETTLDDKEVYATYHELWRIEETFRMMKSQLDARPVYLQKTNSIKGHFLVCYLSVLLERLVQLKVLKGKFSTNETMEFVRCFRAVGVSERNYINVSKTSGVLEELESTTGLCLGSYYLTKGQITDIMNYKFPCS